MWTNGTTFWFTASSRELALEERKEIGNFVKIIKGWDLLGENFCDSEVANTNPMGDTKISSVHTIAILEKILECIVDFPGYDWRYGMKVNSSRYQELLQEYEQIETQQVQIQIPPK